MAIVSEHLSDVLPSRSREPAFASLGPEDDMVARGRALSNLAIEEMISELRLRAERHLLDRGLRLSLPYFDDRRLALRYWSFTVIPNSRILFVPAFVVLAAERETERIRSCRELTPSTRDHLLEGMRMLERAFRSHSSPHSPSGL